MRVRNSNDTLSVHAIAGTHVVLLGFGAKGYDKQSKPESDSRLSNMLSELTLDNTDTATSTTTPSISRITRSSTSSSSIKVKNTSRAMFVGFAIDRQDCSTKEVVTLNKDNQPIQKFHFGDYSALPGKQYQYTVRKMIKDQSNSSSSQKFVAYGSPVFVRIKMEDPATGKHGIYFNRGVAGSAAYNDKFGSEAKYHLVHKFGTPLQRRIINPRMITDPVKSKEALSWLSRGLEEALVNFISQASGKDFQLLATVYEFTHPETVQAFADAVERGVEVKIIRHCKGTYHTRVKRNEICKDDSGKILKDWIPDGTTDSAKKAIDAVGFTSLDDAHKWQHDTFIERHHTAGIMHNKFIILIKDGKPMQVWTGSTNPTDGGIYGQSNVGHIVRDQNVAEQFTQYWHNLSHDPSGRKRRTSSSDNDKASNEPMDELNEHQQPDLEGKVKSQSVTVIFSPRTTTNMLTWYADRMGEATESVHYTAAFGISQPIAQVLSQGNNMTKKTDKDGLRRSPRIARRDNGNDTSVSPSLLRYVLLDNKPSEQSSEKKAASAEKNGKEYLDYYDIKDIKQNRIAFGALLPPPTNHEDKSTVDTNSTRGGECLTGLTSFVDYIHTKYMILDALTDNPLVVTGSANFSMASTDKNDENMLIIQGDTSVADIYLTEFYRLFDHFKARDEYNAFIAEQRSKGGKIDRVWGDIVTDESWLIPYFDPESQLYKERLLLR